jgi:lysozyme family protein
MALTPAQTRKGYINLFKSATILPSRREDVRVVVARLVKGRQRYEALGSQTGIPWWFIAILHERESGCDFGTYLGNGQSLKRRTTIEPKGRGPFATFEEGAIDALRIQGYLDHKDYSLPTAFWKVEGFNGWGYVYHGENSPYVWGATNHQQRGKYTSDAKFNSKVWDTQVGAAAMILGLVEGGHLTIPESDLAQAGAEADPVVYEVGDRGDGVRDLQTRLRALGYQVGAIDGWFGEATADAVVAFQRRQGLGAADGKWRKSYAVALGSAKPIVSDVRAKATPLDLEAAGDWAGRALRAMRNLAVYVAGLIGVAAQFGGFSDWVRVHAWIVLIVIAVSVAIIAQLVRWRRVKDYRTGDYQGPFKAAGGAQ